MFGRINKQHFSCEAAWGWGTKFCNHEKLYLFTRNFHFMYWQALWIKVFYLQPPAERLKAMLRRVKQHSLFGHVHHLQFLFSQQSDNFG